MQNIRATLIDLLAKASLNGRYVDLSTELPRRRIGWDSERSTCEIARMDVPTDVALTGTEPAFVDVWANGQPETFFVGVVDAAAAAQPSLSRGVTLVDQLGQLRRRVSTEINWSNRSFTDAVFDLLIQAGIPQVASIADPGFVLGAEQTISIKTSERIATVFQELMEYGGCVAWVAPDGGIRIDQKSAIPSATYATLPDGTPIIYANGATGTELGITGADWQLGTPEKLVNGVTITGPTLPSGITPTGAAELSGIVGEPWNRQLRFVQDATTAQAIAVRELSRRAVNVKTIRVTAPYNPYLMPGMTLGFRDALLGISTTTPAKVWAVEIRGHEMTFILKLGAHVVDGYNPLQPPLAVFQLTIEQEPIVVSGSTVVRYFVQCDGSLSFDPDGQVLGWSWSAPTATPSSSTDPRPIFVFDSLTGKSITLTVTDDQGQTGSVTKQLADFASQVVVRTLSVAEGAAGWAVLPDGTTWRTFSRSGRSCTSVPSFNEKGPLIAGWDDGKVYKTEDSLATAATLLGTVGSGPVDALFVNETNNLDMLAAIGATLYKSNDGGLSWTAVKTFAAAITDIQSSPVNLAEWAVATGATAQRTFDSGTTWTTYVTGPSGATARALASAPWGHAVVFTGGATGIVFEEGSDVDWSGVSGGYNDLLSVTPLLTTEGFIVGDTNATLYLLLKDGSDYVASLIGTLPSPASGSENVNDLVRDGRLASLAFAATEAGTHKLVNLSTRYLMRSQPSLQLGYGALGQYRLEPMTLVSTPGEERVLSLWNGASNDAPPSNWETVAFDDSAWGLSVLAAVYPFDPFQQLPGTQPVWSTGTTSAAVAGLLRRHFMVGSGNIGQATLTVKCDNYTLDVYLNGVRLGGNLTNVNTLTFDVKSVVNAGGPNVLAIQAAERDNQYTFISYKLEIS